MSLERFVKQEIQRELDAKRASHEQKYQELERESAREVGTMERAYKTEVERSIDSQVNLEAFQGKKSATFETAQSLNDQIEALYVETLPEILTSTFGSNRVAEFLKPADGKTAFTVTGTKADLLTNLLSDFKKSQISVEQSADLGSITYTTGDTTYEFSLRDLIEAAKAKTLHKVTASI